MVLFFSHIRELLFQYDCVVIPNFGGFICSFSPAKIHPVQHTFYPPGKKISFNRMLVMNDGLLAHYIAVKENLMYDQSMDLITNEVNRWKEELHEGRQLAFDGIGKFFLDESGNLQFQQELKTNFLSDSYGLSSFQVMPVDRSQKLKVVHKANKEVSGEEENTRRLPLVSKMARYTAAAAVLSVAMLSAYKMNVFQDLTLSELSLNPFKNETGLYESHEYRNFTTEEEMPSLKEKIAGSSDAIYFYDPDIPDLEKKLVVKLKDPVKLPEKKPEVVGKYHVVGGCFGVESNAKKMLGRLSDQGFRADMSIMHKGLHVVSYQSFEKEKDARKFLKEIKSRHNNQAWLLVK